MYGMQNTKGFTTHIFGTIALQFNVNKKANVQIENN